MTNAYDPARQPNGQFAPGNPGRRVGSRNKLSRRIVNSVLTDFEEHQDEILRRLRSAYLPRYVALVGKLLPREDNVVGLELDDLSDAEMAQVVLGVQLALRRIEEGVGSLADLESAVLTLPAAAPAP
jgi:hypothetical protein